MELSEKSILVPVDFTENSEFAFQHALQLSKFIKKNITLLHIIKKDGEHPAALDKLKVYGAKMQEKYGVDTHLIVRKGDIYKAIKTSAIEINALLIVMGLHSAKKAIKVIIGSNIPFFLIQAPPMHEKINDIVVPVDYNEKNRIQMNWASLLSKYFDSNINIIKTYISNKHKNDKMKMNMLFIRSVLDKKGIVFGVRTAKRDAKFNDAIYGFASEINADAIFIMSYHFKEFILKAKKFGLKVPVLCINPATNTQILPGKY
jgi:nucleotide-binding universal stress UspA family protein